MVIKMKTFNYIITDKLGIHARPASMLVKEARKYQSEIKIKKGENEVFASQMLMLMSLGVKKGDEVIITINGEDEEVAYEAIAAFLKDNL